MKTLILNTFSSFATFPMFNPAYLKGLLCRSGIECKHIDVNQIIWNELLNKEFIGLQKFHKELIQESPFPYSIINTIEKFEIEKKKVIDRVDRAKEILRSSDARNLRNLRWAQMVIFRAMNVIYCGYGTFFMTNIPYWANIGSNPSNVDLIYGVAKNDKINPLIRILENKVIPLVIKYEPKIVLVDIMFPWDIIPALTMNILIKKYLPLCHINYAGQGFDEFSFSRIQHKLDNSKFFFGFDSIFIYRNDTGLVDLVKSVLSGNRIGNIENLCIVGDSVPKINYNKLFDESIIPNYDDIDWDRYFYPERIVTDRLSYRCFWARCNFCSINSNKQIEQKSSIDSQVQKIKHIHRNYKVENFWFLDEACPSQFAIKFADNIFDECIYWSLRTRLDKNLTEKNLVKLSQAGLRELWIGLEHVDEKILNLMNKSNFNKEYVLVARSLFDNATKANIGLHFCHILGFPSESEEQRGKVLTFYKELHESLSRKPFFTTFNIFGLMFDSPMFKSPGEFGICDIKDSEELYDMIKVPYRTLYNDDTDSPLVLERLSCWIQLYTNSIVQRKELIPTWLAITDTPFEFYLKKYYTYNPFFRYELD